MVRILFFFFVHAILLIIKLMLCSSFRSPYQLHRANCFLLLISWFTLHPCPCYLLYSYALYTYVVQCTYIIIIFSDFLFFFEILILFSISRLLHSLHKTRTTISFIPIIKVHTVCVCARALAPARIYTKGNKWHAISPMLVSHHIKCIQRTLFSLPTFTTRANDLVSSAIQFIQESLSHTY